MTIKTFLSKVWYSALMRILVGFFIIAIIYGSIEFFCMTDFHLPHLSKNVSDILLAVFGSILGIVVYILLFRFYEKREITEISFQKVGKNIGLGVIIGFGILSLGVLVLYLFGDYKILKINGISSVLPALIIAIISGVFEELMFRGVLFRITEKSLGSIWALIISAVLFGLIHLSNPHSNLLAATSIAIEAGLLLGVAYMYSRNLWLPIAIHFAWNLTQGGIWGINVSGMKIAESLITPQITGSYWLTGGEFGLEAAIQTLLLCLIISILLYILCLKENKVIKPIRKKRPNQDEIVEL